MITHSLLSLCNIVSTVSNVHRVAFLMFMEQEFECVWYCVYVRVYSTYNKKWCGVCRRCSVVCVPLPSIYTYTFNVCLFIHSVNAIPTKKSYDTIIFHVYIFNFLGKTLISKVFNSGVYDAVWQYPANVIIFFSYVYKSVYVSHRGIRFSFNYVKLFLVMRVALHTESVRSI